MRRSLAFVLAVLLVALCAGNVRASLVVDGAISAGEYALSPIIDPADAAADFFGTGLDIDKVYFGEDTGSRYIGMGVVGPPFDINGSALSFARATGVAMYFYNSSADIVPQAYMALNFTDLGFQDDLSFIREWDGLSWVQTVFNGLTPGAGNDYEVAIANAMELRIAKSAFQVFNGSSFPEFVRIQLDDTGFQQDDQVEGRIPEPATLSLLLIGGCLPLLRRSR